MGPPGVVKSSCGNHPKRSGVIAGQSLLVDRVTALLGERAPDATLILPTARPIVGAVCLALERIGASSEAIARARAEV